MNAIEKLRQIVDQISANTDPLRNMDGDWALAGRLLSRMPIDQTEVQRAIKEKDRIALDVIVQRIEKPDAKPDVAASPPSDEPTPEVSDDEMKAAMKAFRKRLKLARLADESSLKGRRLTSGKASEIDAILPPQEYGWHVWDALARAGKLEHTGGGFYALTS
ncbi:MAG: hypothetical protein AAFX05_09115 [Planctomycetota bacterium]